jgi:hypothetical protein
VRRHLQVQAFEVLCDHQHNARAAQRCPSAGVGRFNAQ